MNDSTLLIPNRWAVCSHLKPARVRVGKIVRTLQRTFTFGNCWFFYVEGIIISRQYFQTIPTECPRSPYSCAALASYVLGEVVGKESSLRFKVIHGPLSPRFESFTAAFVGGNVLALVIGLTNMWVYVFG